MTTAQPLTFRLQQLERERGLRIDLGTVTCDAQGQLTIVAAEPKLDHYLADIVAQVNNTPQLHIKVPPPPGAEPHGVYWLTVARTSPNLHARLQQYLEQRFSVALVQAPATTPAAAAAPVGAAGGIEQQKAALKERLKILVPKVKAALARKAAKAAGAEASVRQAIDAHTAGDLNKAQQLLDAADALLAE